MKKRLCLFTAALVLASGVLMLPTRPAMAIAPGLHGLSLTGTVDQFPCIIPSCTGSVGGTGTALVAGLSTSSQPFLATWPNPKAPTPLANATGSLFNMVDSCPVGGPLLSPTGGGSGTFTLTGGLLVYQGTQQAGAQLTGNFAWLRVDPTNIVVTVSGATVLAPNGTVIATQAALIDGAGPGAWVVSGTPTCGAPATNPSIRIVADYLAPE